jgi:hypothetical protein
MAILRALEAKPAVAIAADFAARTAQFARAQSPVRRVASIRATHYGRTAGWISLVALAIAVSILWRS